MRRIGFAIFALLLSGCDALNRAFPHTVEEPGYAAPDKRPVRLAVVLSSGAMRGFAHAECPILDDLAKPAREVGRRC